jgi:hypothetical protein
VVFLQTAGLFLFHSIIGRCIIFLLAVVSLNKPAINIQHSKLLRIVSELKRNFLIYAGQSKRPVGRSRCVDDVTGCESGRKLVAQHRAVLHT